MNNDVLTAMDHNYDGSEGEDNVPEPVTPPASKVKKGDFGAFSLNRFPAETPSLRGKRVSRNRLLNLEDPKDGAIRRSLDEAARIREEQIRNGTHFSVQNMMNQVEVPEGATHKITNGVLAGEFAVIVGNGEKGSLKVTLVGGRRNGSTSFILPADLQKL